MIEINPYIWYANRKLDKAPPHFVKANTPLTSESEFWVKTKLIGRYSTMQIQDTTFLLDATASSQVYFEDPAEAMIYELRWSGGK